MTRPSADGDLLLDGGSMATADEGDAIVLADSILDVPNGVISNDVVTFEVTDIPGVETDTTSVNLNSPEEPEIASSIDGSSNSIASRVESGDSNFGLL
ncbi:MAG: hypothetical protein SWY16_13060 [Cyanobacteriota bacterium]|nr:hypothetical protein [Cyanobacteriota bacterium]